VKETILITSALPYANVPLHFGHFIGPYLPAYCYARFQRMKGAIKLHVQLDHQGCLPCWALVTDGDTNEVRIAQRLSFAPGTIVVVDRGYLDYALYQRWTAAGVWSGEVWHERHPASVIWIGRAR